jgi:diacylglycerol O-acyltransferase / wax synthase
MSTRDAPNVNEGNWSAVAEWSTSGRMNDLEAVMWRAERHPWLSSIVMAVELLDSVPDWDRLRAAHEWGARLVSRFTQRVVEPAVPVGPPAWVPDENFDLDYHLRRIALPAPGDHAQLLELAQSIAMTPLDRARPLWEATVVEGLADGRAAYILKSHHSLSDGIAGIQLLGGMHSRSREPSPDKPEPKPRRPLPTTAGLPLAGAEIAGYARELPAAARSLVPALARIVGRPRGSAARGIRLLGSLRRVSSTPAAPSPLLRPRSGRAWRFQTVECRLDELKAAGRAAGGSVNDAYLAALLGGLRRYHAHFGAEIGDIPVAIPVSLRRADDPMGGNRFSAAQIAGPASIADPAERIAAIRGTVLAARAEPALDLAGLAAPVLSRLPSEVAILARAHIGAQADLSASNFPGLGEDVYIAGARIERMFAFGPLPGSAVMATLVSHQGVCCVSLNCDGDAIEDPDLLRRCVQEGFDEVLALA